MTARFITREHDPGVWERRLFVWTTGVSVMLYCQRDRTLRRKAINGHRGLPGSALLKASDLNMQRDG